MQSLSQASSESAYNSDNSVLAPLANDNHNGNRNENSSRLDIVPIPTEKKISKPNSRAYSDGVVLRSHDISDELVIKRVQSAPFKKSRAVDRRGSSVYRPTKTGKKSLADIPNVTQSGIIPKRRNIVI